MSPDDLPWPDYDDGPPPPKLCPLDLADFLAMDIPVRELLLGPWLPAKGLALLYAARGIGKTHLALSTAYAVATGTGFLDWHAAVPRRVIVLDGEMPGATLQERWRRLVKESRGAPAPGFIRLLCADLTESGLPDLSEPDGQDQLERYLAGADLIVLDNISTLCRSGKENEAESWASLQAWALGQRRRGRSVLFIHHAGKGGDQRGTSKREDVMDTVIRLSRPRDYVGSQGARFVVDFTKARGMHGAAADPFEARFIDGRWTRRAIEDVELARVLELRNEGFTQRDMATETGLSLSKVNRILQRHKEAEGCVSKP